MPNGTPTATPSVTSRSEVGDREVAVPAAMVAVVVTDLIVAPASVTVLVMVAVLLGDVEPDERLKITYP